MRFERRELYCVRATPIGFFQSKFPWCTVHGNRALAEREQWSYWGNPSEISVRSSQPKFGGYPRKKEKFRGRVQNMHINSPKILDWLWNCARFECVGFQAVPAGTAAERLERLSRHFSSYQHWGDKSFQFKSLKLKKFIKQLRVPIETY